MDPRDSRAGLSSPLAPALIALLALLAGCLKQNPEYDPTAGGEAADAGPEGAALSERCSEGLCGDHARCDDSGGAAVCACEDGYEGDGSDCADVDECDAGTHDCGEHAICDNTEGSFSCACEEGYTGNGRSCVDVDECQLHTDACDTAVANCENTEGGYDCLCRFTACDDGCCAEGAVCHATEGVCCAPSGCEVGGPLEQDDGCGHALDCTPWVDIAGGSFTMGSAAIGTWTAPEHVVAVPGFRLWRTEVTVAEYADCVSDGPCAPPVQCSVSYNWGVSGRERHPLNCATWEQAAKFCAWVGGRLPTEAEWEYAASNGAAEDLYPWGDSAPSCERAVYEQDGAAAGSGCDGSGTQAVCSRSPLGDSGGGLCDMAGNTWEWVEDDYFGFSTGYVGAPADGRAWVKTPRTATRIIRGGSFGDPAEFMPAAYRADMDPASFDPGVGFRCARAAD